MTARRRRRSGSGPSATALIAWAGGAPADTDGPLTPAGSSWQPPTQPVAESWLPRSGRARGLAAGALIACGSVLAVAVHAADSSSGPGTRATPELVTVSPGSEPGGNGETSLNVAASASLAPAVTSSQALSGFQHPPRVVTRNVPVGLPVPTADQVTPSAQSLLEEPSGGTEPHRPGGPLQRAAAPLAPVAGAAEGVVHGVVAPAQHALTPPAEARAAEPQSESVTVDNHTAPAETVTDLGEEPVDEGAQPAMAMLAPPLLG